MYPKKAIPKPKDRFDSASKIDKNKEIDNKNDQQKKSNNRPDTASINDKDKESDNKNVQTQSITKKKQTSSELIQKSSRPPKIYGQEKTQNEQDKQLENEINKLNLEIQQLNQKYKEDKQTIKNLRQQIQDHQTEKNELQNDLKEKNEIIKKILEKNIDEKRDFILHSQLIKQRRYIQHLTKLVKNSKHITTEVEYQLNSIISIFEQENEGKLLKFQQKMIQVQKKLYQVFSQQAVSFIPNLLKEYDQNSGKQMSMQQYTMQLERSANIILKSLQPNNINLSNQLRIFIELCLMHGLDVQLDENLFEKKNSNEQLNNSVLVSFQEKVNQHQNSLNIMNQNNEMLKVVQSIDIDQDLILRKYQNQTFLDIYLENTGKKQDDFMKKMQILVNYDQNLLIKQYNMIKLLYMESQKSYQDLNIFVKDLFKDIQNTIQKNIYQPFMDIMEIYYKYYKYDKDPNYGVHLSMIFNKNCENICQNLSRLIQTDEQLENQSQPLIKACMEKYKQMYNQYLNQL